MKHFLLFLLLLLVAFGAQTSPEYSIQAIHYADSPGDSVADMVMGAPKEEKLDTIYAIWLIRGGGHNIIFDSGFHRERWFKERTIKDYLRSDEAVKLAGVKPEEITDVVISHTHWDHMGGIDLFPKAAVWIQREVFAPFTGGRHTYASQYLRVEGHPPLVLHRAQSQRHGRIFRGGRPGQHQESSAHGRIGGFTRWRDSGA
jgi:glyoxylase-like metal-dependent hydrolase (beta-lactamase superfamily II)